MSEIIKPILLCADSQILFWRQTDGLPFLSILRALVTNEFPTAAYLGAANDDLPEFYTIFLAAMENIGITACRMIPSVLSAEDAAFLRASDIILLAGGDPLTGWRIFEENGVCELITERYFGGAVLMGISAGAAQLGQFVCSENEADRGDNLKSTFGFVPFLIGAHEEKDSWRGLLADLKRAPTAARALGIESGGGALFYHADLAIIPVRKPLQQFSVEGQDIKTRTLHVSPKFGLMD